MHSKRPTHNWRGLLLLEISLIVAFLVLAGLTALKLIGHARINSEERAAAQFHEAFMNDATTVPTITVAPETAVTPAPEVQHEIVELQEQNPDAVGLLHFEGDRTLYVCQTTDNSYYMAHRFDGSEDPAGMIYMDFRNSLWPRSDNLILYGHNMRDGSRFGTLSHFECASHMKEYPIFQLVDLYETVNYVPIAIFHTTVLTDDPSYYAFDRTDFASEADFDQYIADVQLRSLIDIPLTAEYGEKLLTLATCSSSQERGRLVIVLREVHEGERFD